MIERMRLAGVRPLEVWDLRVRGRLWYRALAGGDPAHALLEGLRRLRRSLAFDRVVVDGGRVSQLNLRHVIERAPFPITLGTHGRWAGVEAGLARIESGLVVDLGQTALKIGIAARKRRRVLVPRDLELFPIVPAEKAPSRRGRPPLVSWIASSMARHLAVAPELILALPARISSRAIPSACTYGGLAGAAFVPALLRAIAAPLPARHPWRRVHARVINDAELAAGLVEALPGERVLALTLGFGPGAALVEGA